MKELLERKTMILNKMEEFEMNGNIQSYELAFACLDVVCKEIKELQNK